jgi:hypothetical protein
VGLSCDGSDHNIMPLFSNLLSKHEDQGSAPVRRWVKKVLEKLMASFALSTTILAAVVSLVVGTRGGFLVIPHVSQVDLLEC